MHTECDRWESARATNHWESRSSTNRRNQAERKIVGIEIDDDEMGNQIERVHWGSH